MKGSKETGGTGNMDEGRNEATRLQYTDSISVPASENTLKKHKKEANTRHKNG